MYGGGYYRMDSAAARPYYGYQNPAGGYGAPRGSFYGGGGGIGAPSAPQANGVAGGWGGRTGHGPTVTATPASNAPDGARAGPPLSGVFTGPGPMQQRPKKGGGVGGASTNPGMSQVSRTGSISLPFGNRGSFRGIDGLVRQPSYGGFGSAFGSFRSNGGGVGPVAMGSGISNPDAHPLPRVHSGMDFGYSYGSFVQGSQPGMPRGGVGGPGNTSLMTFGGGSTDGNGLGAGAGGSAMQRNNSMPSYSYGSFANGLPGIGPGTSLSSMGGRTSSDVSSNYDNFSPNDGNSHNGGTVSTQDIYNLQRQDSQNMLQRKYSIAGQFYNFDQAAGPSTPGIGGGVRPGMMLNGRSGGVFGNGVGAMGGMGGFMGNQQRPQGGGPGGGGGQHPQQRRLGEGGMKSTDDIVTEGAPTALGRKNSVSNMLERKDSQKRVGMYFKNKEASQDDVEYKKDGDPGTTKTASSKSRDPSLVNNVKPILLFDASEDGRDGKGVANEVEIDGKTVRAVKPGNEEIQKYDMREVIFVNTREDVEVTGDSLDEIRDQFCNGANVGMLMADAECKASEPTEWFSWTALKTVMKNVFAKVDSVRSATASSSVYSPKFEVTVSVCVLQDDQMLDLLGDDSNFDTDDYRLESLVVAESPLFGNVPNNAVFVVVENADEFNDTLDACLERARGFFHHEDEAAENHRNLDDVEEYGIVLATVVLKQTRKSSSSGKYDVVVSSIFASGVGDGVIHYNRIMDKNPAEPRALFYSVLHRSCHSTAIFSLKQNNSDIFGALTTLQRFSRVELRKPKLGSVRQFLYYTESTMPKIKEDLAKMKEGKQKIQTQRFMERLELMSQDMEQMLEDPEGCVPKTYI